MAFDQHANLVYTLVETPPTPPSTGTSLVVKAGSGAQFPAPPFNLTVWPVGAVPLRTNAEIIRVTAVTTDTLTFSRAQEGTTARVIAPGDQIAMTITAKVLTDIETSAGGGGLAGPASSAVGGVASWADATGRVSKDSGLIVTTDAGGNNLFFSSGGASIRPVSTGLGIFGADTGQYFYVVNGAVVMNSANFFLANSGTGMVALRAPTVSGRLVVTNGDDSAAIGIDITTNAVLRIWDRTFGGDAQVTCSVLRVETAAVTNAPVTIRQMPTDPANSAGFWFVPVPDTLNYSIFGRPGQTCVNVAPTGGVDDIEFRVSNDTRMAMGAAGVSINSAKNVKPTLPFAVKNAAKTVDLLQLTDTGVLTLSFTLGMTEQLVGSLPGSPPYGTLANVSDSQSEVLGDLLSGGGTKHVLARYGSAGWRVASTNSPAGAGSGTGDVSGPSSAVIDNLVTFGATSGKTVKDSGIAITNMAQLNVANT